MRISIKVDNSSTSHLHIPYRENKTCSIVRPKTHLSIWNMQMGITGGWVNRFERNSYSPYMEYGDGYYWWTSRLFCIFHMPWVMLLWLISFTKRSTHPPVIPISRFHIGRIRISFKMINLSTSKAQNSCPYSI